MPAISRLIVVQSDSRIAEAVRFGFERDGARVVSLPRGDAVASALAQARDGKPGALPDLAIAGAASADAARELLGDLRQALDEAGARAPILYLGGDLGRQEALAAGASERLAHPAFVRDVVTVGRLLVTARRREPLVVEGQLSDYGGVLYILRAMVAMRRTGVLSLVRGLRRGELRFYEGEVTSAQVSVLHGLAALHQILLWTRAHFELRDETVLRRRQIPLLAEEILADAERFVSEIRTVAGTLIPSAVYEPDRDAIRARKGAIPQPVHRVLKLIDGYRTMGDVIEESPYRVLETLQIANRLVETGLIRCQGTARDASPLPDLSPGGAPGVSIERWLADRFAERTPVPIGSVELEPLSERPLFGEEEEDDDEGAGAGYAGIARMRTEPADDWVDEWTDILPTEMSSGFSPVVPATEAAGEIISPDDAAARAASSASARIVAEGAQPGAAWEEAVPDGELALADTAPVDEPEINEIDRAAPAPSGGAETARALSSEIGKPPEERPALAGGAEAARSPSIWGRIFRKPQPDDPESA